MSLGLCRDPAEVTRASFTPRSIPTVRPLMGFGVTVSAARRLMNQRPALSRVTVAEDTADRSTGRDHTISSGSACFASFTFPLRRDSPDLMYFNPKFDFFNDLKRGYFARLAQKFTNAVCRWRSDCWSGTEETSRRKENSSVFFHWVSILLVSA